MMAVIYNRFGPVDELALGEVPTPVPQPGQVLVRVNAASVNVIDSRARSGLMGPLVNSRFPKIPCADFSGRVVAITPEAREFREGDAVFGALDPLRGGALAEFVAVSTRQLAPKPATLSFEEAAALPVAGLAALTSVRTLGRLQSGQNLLVHGASGGVGLCAIQLAKHLGAHVTAVAGPAGLAAVREARADRVIDYTKAGDSTFGDPFDVIINASGKLPFAVGRRLLKPAGRLIEPSPTIPVFIGSRIANLFRRQKHLVLQTAVRSADLSYLSSLITSGDLKVYVGRTFPWSEFKAAFASQEKGGTIGKIVMSVTGT